MSKKCLVKEACFYGGKRYREGEHIHFDGKVIPPYLEYLDTKKPKAKKEEVKPAE